MQPTAPLPLYHSWPLTELSTRLDLGRVHDGALDLADATRFARAVPGIGLWECRLDTEKLRWADPVYDMFGLPRGSDVARAMSLALYAEESRAAMERLRTHILRHRRGFTLDVRINAADGRRRWLRLIAAVEARDAQPIRLHGLKSDVTHLYD